MASRQDKELSGVFPGYSGDINSISSAFAGCESGDWAACQRASHAIGFVFSDGVVEPRASSAASARRRHEIGHLGGMRGKATSFRSHHGIIPTA